MTTILISTIAFDDHVVTKATHRIRISRNVERRLGDPLDTRLKYCARLRLPRRS